MTVTYGFYDSLNGDRKYNAIQLSSIFNGIITDGIFLSQGLAFRVRQGSGMVLYVDTGRAWFNNTWTYNDGTIGVTVLASEAVLNRVDSVVIEVNSDTAVRANSIKVIKGTPASSPVAPTMANTATLHQYRLADVYVAANATSLSDANITDKRGLSGGAPFITGILTSLDISTLLGQFQASFSSWFTNLQNQLDANQAANLQNQIDKPRLSSFLATKTATSSNVTGDNTSFVVVCNDEIVDVGSHYNSANGIYTAPYTGLYLASMNVLMREVAQANHTDLELDLVVSGVSARTYQFVQTIIAADTDYVLSSCPLVYMTAGDTAQMVVAAFGNSKVVDVFGAAGNMQTRFGMIFQG